MDSMSVVSLRKILVVDDNELSGRLLLSILVKAGYDVELCHRGSDAIEKIENAKIKYDLILTDVLMPLMGGFDFIGRVKKMGGLSAFMVVSCMRDHETMVKAKSLGASDYITKPFKKDDIIEKLESFFNRSDKMADASGL
ncbi:MAG: hypothetical protein RJB66_124 [Pseudomonadota bacterium]|jgi:DNA-binding response OmpR family regulator